MNKYIVTELRTEITYTEYYYEVEAETPEAAQEIIEDNDEGIEWSTYLETNAETLDCKVTEVEIDV